MAAPQLQPQVYDDKESVLFTIPQTGATVNVNSLPENVVDELIRTAGAQPPLLARKAHLEQQRVNTQAQAKTTEEQIQAEALKRSEADLNSKLDSIFKAQGDYGTQQIEDKFAPQRSRVASELAASGNLGSGVGQASLQEVDRQKGNAMGQLFAGLGSQRAAGQMDFAKTIESILAGERRAKEAGDQFGQSLQFGRDKLLAGINESNESRGLDRYSLDAQLRQRRDMAEPEEWAKQMGRINGIFDIYNKAQKAGANTAFLAKGGKTPSFLE